MKNTSQTGTGHVILMTGGRKGRMLNKRGGMSDEMGTDGRGARSDRRNARWTK